MTLDSDPFVRQHCDNDRPHPEHYWQGIVAGGRWCAGTVHIGNGQTAWKFDRGRPADLIIIDDPLPRVDRKPLPRWAWLRRRRRSRAQARIRTMMDNWYREVANAR